MSIKRKRGVRLPLTPITEETFKRQGWKKIMIDSDPTDGEDEIGDIYYFTLPLPKNRTDEFTPFLISNATDEIEALLELGLQVGTFFVELMNTDGLGFCSTEEELEILYRALTRQSIE